MAGKKKFQSRDNEVGMARQQNLGPFVLDELHAKVKTIVREVTNNMQKLLSSNRSERDPDLLRPWDDMRKTSNFRQHGDAGIIEKELKLIEDHVDSLAVGWSRTGGSNSTGSFEGEEKLTKRKKEQQKLIQGLQEKFRKTPEGIVFLPLLGPNMVDILKASYAYRKSSSEAFAFSMAFKLLCHIKAEACGSTAIARQFSESMSIPSSIVRLLTLEQQNEGE